MADLSKIKVGDSLTVPVEVVYIDNAYGAPVQVAPQGDISVAFWLDRKTVLAAEHIPAPRIFKRGDWVKWSDGTKQMVIADSGFDGYDCLWVTSDDPTTNILWRKQDCEPTEAPE